MKVTRQGIRNRVGFARDVIKTWDITVLPLMKAKQAEKICRRLVGGRASLALPKGSVEVITLGKDGSFTDVEGMCRGI